MKPYNPPLHGPYEPWKAIELEYANCNHQDPKRRNDFIVTCSGCGKERAFSGMLTARHIRNILRSNDWALAPEPRCPHCKGDT